MEKHVVTSEDSESLGTSLVALVRGNLLNVGHTLVFWDVWDPTVLCVTMTMMSKAELSFKVTPPVP